MFDIKYIANRVCCALGSPGVPCGANAVLKMLSDTPAERRVAGIECHYKAGRATTAGNPRPIELRGGHAN
jgi:hypothetical protein